MKPVLIAITLLFGAYSVYAMSEVGYFGIIAAVASPGGLQVAFDLVIACLLISFWMVSDARAHGRNPWPYVLITLLAGSFGPLLYLLLAGQRDSAIAREVVQRA
jgi:hypothetical protein